MKEYLLLLRGGKPMATKTEAENKAEMQAWGKYMGGLGEKASWLAGYPSYPEELLFQQMAPQPNR